MQNLYQWQWREKGDQGRGERRRLHLLSELVSEASALWWGKLAFPHSVAYAVCCSQLHSWDFPHITERTRGKGLFPGALFSLENPPSSVNRQMIWPSIFYYQKEFDISKWWTFHPSLKIKLTNLTVLITNADLKTKLIFLKNHGRLLCRMLS